MLDTTKKTLHTTESSLVVWIEYVNNDLFDIKITDKITDVTYRVAEYDGLKYRIHNMETFNNMFIKLVKDQPQIINEMRKFMSYHHPEAHTFNVMVDGLKAKFKAWRVHKVNIIKKLWQPK